MTAPARPNSLARALRDFFADHLPRLRGMSPHTIHSYRDSLSLLLRYLAIRRDRPVADLDLVDVLPRLVMDFLQHLESKRRNSAGTRNVRLAAIHSFFRHVATRQPEQLECCQRILAIPFKRTRSRAIEYLEYEEMQAVLEAIDRATASGRRDYALLVAMFNTGARVQELLDLRARDLQLLRPFQARLVGKGRKERICPLWPQTADVLREYLAELGIAPASGEALFRNHRQDPLTRYGVRYILRKYCERAQGQAPTLAGKRLHPHSMRHSTAVHLLRSGVDLATIGRWLGHANVNTTNRYTTVDLETKRKALAKAKPIATGASAAATWRGNASILEWLQAL
jgi:integrase/recombinase XerD